jgi:hypothetical protein
MCAPAMAATITVTDNLNSTVTVTVTRGGAEPNIVGLALDVDLDQGSVTAVSAPTPATFNIYPDAAYSDEIVTPNSYVYGSGTPVADQDNAGEIALPQQNFCLSLGNLNGESTPGADGSLSVSITLTLSDPNYVEVCENSVRGGIVAVDGTALDADCASADNIQGASCRDKIFSVQGSDARDLYDAYITAGKDPNCWCWRYQCYGDSDNATEYVLIEGDYRIYDNDLTALSNNWKRHPTSTPAADPCADFGHDSEYVLIEGDYSVYDSDLTILSNHWKDMDSDLTTDCATYLP